jgi:Transglutaminase-like superfamily
VDADDLDYYAGQSAVTDPGQASSQLTGIPTDIAGLHRAAHGLVIHYRAEDPVGQGIPAARMAEIDSRHAETMLDRLAALADQPLTEQREPQERLVGCCRDFTVLFLAMARSLAVPARARVGFGSYFVCDYKLDHELAEVWDSAENRWRLLDANIGAGYRDPNDGATIDPLDVPRDRFLVAGAAWQRCRRDEDDPASFVVSPQLELPDTRGWPYLRHNVVHDLAALNKTEMLLWDGWGLAEQPEVGDDELALLDRLAALTAAADPPLADLRRLFREEALRVPPVVTSWNPLTGEPRTVALGGKI